MSEPVIPTRAKLFMGLLVNSDLVLERTEFLLQKKYGEIDFKTVKMPFDHTEYYSKIGKNLFRVFLSFKKLVRREDIVKIKLYANGLEKKLSEKDNRRVNIDPGYLTLSNVYLATCKEFFHRVYLREGVYLENEYRYVARRFEPWDWTYPDYRKQESVQFFYNIRVIYARQLKER
ncbi:MAG: DUF4416 family protein [Spirochaetes bacterium]|nr:MAG: DUF4416 family protein [Spirochaetota bacterium]